MELHEFNPGVQACLPALNGFGLEGSERANDYGPEAHWRDKAINAALDAESAYGQCEDSLLAEIRRNRPGCATMMCWLDRSQLQWFLQKECEGRKNLLRGIDRFLYSEARRGAYNYVCWQGARWQNREFEIAFTPGTDSDAPTILICDDAASLESFAWAAADFARRPHGRCLRYSSGWANAPELDEEIGKVTWDDIILAPDISQQLQESINGFLESRTAFQALGFPWRRGILLIGPPGTGKTMVCKAAAASLPSLPFLYVRDLNTRREQEAIRTIFARARNVAPCILAFEDVDGFVVDENRTVFLNEMDGFRNNEGLLIIASSNHPGKIDEALLRRPSRFDRVVHIGPPGKSEREEYCMRILIGAEITRRLSPVVDVAMLASETAAQTDGFTPAYLKELFISAALACAQDGALELDDRFRDAVRVQIKALKKQMRRMRNPEGLSENGSSDAIGIRRHMRL